MATLEELTTAATAEVEALKPLSKTVYADGTATEVELTDAEYTVMINDIANNNWNVQQFSYIELRQQGYGSIGEQLDMQYKDLINDTTTWKDHIAAVKAEFPKPE